MNLISIFEKFENFRIDKERQILRLKTVHKLKVWREKSINHLLVGGANSASGVFGEKFSELFGPSLSNTINEFLWPFYDFYEFLNNL